MTFHEIIKFWFEELEPKQHWIKDTQFDQMLKERFGQLHKAAGLGELYSWRDHAEGRLAEIIVLDQFSRNIYRDTAQSFAYDAMALTLTQEAIRTKADQELPTNQRFFMYMPMMHSESKLIHEQAVQVFKDNGLDLEYEIKHKDIIDRFGRYPHRNKILGRESTPEEIDFLQGPNSSF